MIRSSRRYPHLLWAILPLVVSTPALAQDIASAEVLFERGLADMDAGRYETGCKALAESQRLDPRPGTLFTLAFCESKWGRVATAVARLGDYLRLVEGLPPDQKARQRERAEAAAAERARLAPRVPELTLSLPPGAPAGTVVTRDGLVLGEASIGVALPVDPGEHVVSTRAPGGPVWEQRIAIAEREKKQIALEVKRATGAVAPAPPSPGGEAAAAPAPSPGGEEVSSGRRAAVYVAGGVGVAGVVLGGVMGALTFGQRGTIADHCGAGVGARDARACDTTGYDAAQSASTTGLLSTIGFGVGLAGLGAAAVLYWTEPKGASPKAGAAPTWVSTGVLAAGPAGTVVGVRGAW
ncbi:tetratricopeptide repeat protein [Sorangium sp. So ce385]|uniref:tetratricopeptide repeat protein n=1 Tax=Sorangium sp. So ce385 TaxID=3133308 RepID=UPI003F5CA5E2